MDGEISGTKLKQNHHDNPRLRPFRLSNRLTIPTTERLILRHLTTSDAEALHRIHHEAGVWKYFQGTPPASVDDERAKIEEQLTHYREHGVGYWATV